MSNWPNYWDARNYWDIILAYFPFFSPTYLPLLYSCLPSPLFPSPFLIFLLLLNQLHFDNHGFKSWVERRKRNTQYAYNAEYVLRSFVCSPTKNRVYNKMRILHCNLHLHNKIYIYITSCKSISKICAHTLCKCKAQNVSSGKWNN